jgi:signal peptidase I
MVEFQIVDTWGPGSLSVELTDGHARLEVRFWPSDERFELLLDGQPIPNAENRFGGSLDGRRVVVSLFDRQLLVAVDDQVLGRLPIPTGDAPAEPPAEPIRIGVQVLGVILEGLRLYRDVYYTHPIGVRGRWALGKPAKLGDGEVFVLGDNSPIADDSRTWPEGPGIDVRTLVGRPMILWFRPMPARWGSWDFQVPDPTQIRYIP